MPNEPIILNLSIHICKTRGLDPITSNIAFYKHVLWSLNLASERHFININVFQTVGSYTLNRILTFQILGGESRKTGVSLKKKKWIQETQETRIGFGQEGREGRKRLHSRSRITRMLFGLEGWGLCFSKQTEGALYPQRTRQCNVITRLRREAELIERGKKT